MKKLTITFLFFLTLIPLFGFQVMNPFKRNDLDLKYNCGYFECPGHYWGEPNCETIYADRIAREKERKELYFSSYSDFQEDENGLMINTAPTIDYLIPLF